MDPSDTDSDYSEENKSEDKSQGSQSRGEGSNRPLKLTEA